jgi:hypothetical protein
VKGLLWFVVAAQGKEIIRSTKSTDYGRPWPQRGVFNENNSSEASGLVMWPEALHFALLVLRRVVSWILSNALKLLKKLFNRQHKRTLSLTRERTVTVRDKITVEVTGDIAFGSACDTRAKGEDVKQLVKSLSDAGLL